jgi:hypothetical protein
VHNEKRSAKACQDARPGVWPSGDGSDQPGLIYSLLFVFIGVHEVATLSFFVTFLYQDKKVKGLRGHSGASLERKGLNTF